MMSYSITVRSEQPIVMATCHPDFRLEVELKAMIESILDTVEANGGKMDLIVDMREAKFGLDDMITAANYPRTAERSVFRHPQIERIVYVSASKLVDLAARGLRNPVFGGLNVPVFSSLDDALAHLKT